ncbi:uncharacterized protein [Euwallacea similis]|uniref:uncharacterized protein isoform X2 n=1 Tax=Euwallacea similis TaxID=1736056 RepID=UPI0034506376
MSEINEELLNDDVDDVSDIGQAEEDALLQDDEDILKLDEISEELAEDQKSFVDQPFDSEEKETSRQDKFATERQVITAPDSTGEEKHTNYLNRNPKLKFKGNNARGRGGIRGRGILRGRGAFHRQPQLRRSNVNWPSEHFNHAPEFTSGQPIRNKKVLINPRFQARLAWDSPQNFQSQPNSWMPPGNPEQFIESPPHMHPMQPPPQFQPQMRRFHGPSPMQEIQGLPQMPPPMQRPPHMQMMHQGMQSSEFPPGQMHQFMPQQHREPHLNFTSQNNMGTNIQQPPPQLQMPPPNLPPASGPYWNWHNQTLPQGPYTQMQNAYVENFDQRVQREVDTQMQYNQQQTYRTSITRDSFAPKIKAPYNQVQNAYIENFDQRVQCEPDTQLQYNQQQTYQTTVTRENFAFKRKITPGNCFQTEKRFIQERLGPVQESSIHMNNVTITPDNRSERPLQVTVANVTEEEDEETIDLRRKIEEQRRQREEVFKWKEARRLKRLKRQNSLNPTQPQQQEHQTISAVVQRPLQGNIKNRQVHQQNRHQQQHTLNTSRTPVLQPIKQIDDQQFPLKNRTLVTAKISNRVIPLAQTTVQADPDIQLDKEHLSNFLAERKVLLKDDNLLQTRRVTIRNIATSTEEKKLFQICKGIGEIQKLHRDKNERHATITFKSVSSAHAFFKKYQRYMLDLSMIEVSLTAESDDKE